jgi:hypothetical protein
MKSVGLHQNWNVSLDYALSSAITLGVAYSGQYGPRDTDSVINGQPV